MPRGRMLNKRISTDDKIAKLSLKSTLFYTWCIPYLDIEGRMLANVWSLKAIFPFISEITPKNIPSLIKELVDTKLVTYYGNESHKYLQFQGFKNNQKLRDDREAPSMLPSPFKSNSGVTPDKVTAKSNINLSKDKYKEYIYLSSNEYTALKDKLGQEKLTYFIDQLNNYIGSKGKKYKSHYHTILVWSAKEVSTAKMSFEERYKKGL